MEDGIGMEAPPAPLMAEYVIGLKASAARVDRVPVHSLARRMLAEYGRGQIYEWIHAYTVGLPVFDVDGQTTDTDARSLLAHALDGVRTFFLGDMPPVIIASSHGGSKLSYRILVPGFRMRLSDVKKRILRLGLDDKSGGPFDPAIYGVNQKLRMPGSFKTPQDARVLKLIATDGADVEPTLDLMLSCIVQNVDAAWPLLAEDELPTRKRKAAAAPTHETILPATLPAPPAARRPESPPQQPSQQSSRHSSHPPTDICKAERILQTAGFKDVTWLGSTRPESATFTCRREVCACCRVNTHDRQNWWCAEDGEGALHVKNYSPSCMVRVLREPPIPPTEEAIVTHQQAEEHIKTLQSAVYTLGVYARQQQSHIDAAINPLRMQFGSVVPTTYGFDFSCEGREDIYRCDAIVQSCCQISNRGSADRPLITGYHGASLLQHLADNPTKGDAVYAQWMLLDQRYRGIAWKFDVKVERIYRNALNRWEVVDEHTLRTLFAHMAIEGLARVVDNVDSICPPLQKKVSGGLKAALHHVQSSRAPRNAIESFKMATAHPGFAATLDVEPHLLGCANGVIDLRTGRLLDPLQQVPVSMAARATFHGLDSPTPDIDAFFLGLFEDQDTVCYLQRFLGMAITGELGQHYGCFVGTGSNGKSLTSTLLHHVLGEYACAANSYIFFADRGSSNSATPYVAELDRKRVAVVEESSPTSPLNTEVVKRLTGSSSVNTRELYKAPFEMKVMHTQILCTNSLPQIDVEDQAMLRRVVVFPFDLRFKEPATFDQSNPSHRRADTSLEQRLQESDTTDQLLAWLVRGAVAYYADSRMLGPKPAKVRQAEAAYIRDNDALGQFIDAHCKVGTEEFVVAKELKEALVRAGVSASHNLKRAMCARNFQWKNRKIAGVSTAVYNGVSLCG